MRYCNWYTEEPKYTRCYNLVEDGKTRCDEHKLTTKRTGNLTTRQKIKIREAYGGVCAKCGQPANEVDHIVELHQFPEDEQWKANMPSNLQLLCTKHHLEKTNSYIRQRSQHDRKTSQRNRKRKRLRDMGFEV